jgi:hypothetical protein
VRARQRFTCRIRTRERLRPWEHRRILGQTVRDVVAGLVAILLLLVAGSLATTLQTYRRRRQRARDTERALGRTIIAELPTSDELVIVSEDAKRFYYGERSIDKDLVAAVRVLINGAPIAACLSRRLAAEAPRDPTSFEDRPEGIARDRWDVAVETVAGTVLIECGAIRERVSQELARTIFDAIKRDLERRDQMSATIPFQPRRHGD